MGAVRAAYPGARIARRIERISASVLPSVQAAYTFARAIDQYSAVFNGVTTPNVLDLTTERGLSEFHAKHIGSASWLW